MKLTKLFNKPSIMACVGDVNTGKSMFLYHLLETLSKENKFKLFTYGLRLNFKNAQEIFSVSEMEQVKDSLIIIDELSSLFDLDNRKTKKLTENTLRLINHNNNIILICGTPENFKKFISAKIDCVFFKRLTIADFINGSRVKTMLTNYKGNERGSEMLNLRVNEVLFYSGKHYFKLTVPYYKKYDSKQENVPIFVPKNVPKNVRKNVQKIKCAKTFQRTWRIKNENRK